MDKPKMTPKDFFLWLGAMVSLYWSVIAFIFLIFNYIDYALPNPLAYLGDPYSTGIPYEMASIIVLFPIYLLLVWLIRRDIAADPTRKEIWVRRWAIILTLFVAGVTMVADVITLLTSFFSGEELTLAFIFKITLVFLIAGAGFMHFTADLKGYWDANKSKERLASIAFGILALVTVFSGFIIVGTPAHARLVRFDNQKVNDLQSIQYQVVTYWQAKGKLPTAITDLNDPLSGFTVPLDSQTSAPYTYQALNTYSFKLCATFNTDIQNSNSYASGPVMPLPGGVTSGKDLSNTWDHAAGDTCYLRTIDPERYPVLKK